MTDGRTITVRDRSPGGGRADHEIALSFNATVVALRDIIAERVRMEVDSYQQKAATLFASNLVQPVDAELRLNEARKKRQPRPIDVDEQIEIAFQAFERNGFFVLVGDRQLENLDDRVSLDDAPEIIFIKLMPLVGG